MCGQYKDVRIEFEPKRVIGKTTKDGTSRVLFVPGKTYIGIKYSDGRLVGKSHNWPELTDLQKEDIDFYEI